jgi:hypothetical protein
MYQVKKYKGGDILWKIMTTSIGTIKRAAGGDCFGVIKDGKIVVTDDHQLEIYRLKSAAQKVADWYNQEGK